MVDLISQLWVVMIDYFPEVNIFLLHNSFAKPDYVLEEERVFSQNYFALFLEHSVFVQKQA